MCVTINISPARRARVYTMTNLISIFEKYCQLASELKHNGNYTLLNGISELFGSMCTTRGQELGIETLTDKTPSGADYTAIYRNGAVDIYLHWGLKKSFLEDFETWDPHYKVTGLSPDIVRILMNEGHVNHYGELQWMLQYFKEHGVWTTPNAVELSKALMVLKSLSSRLTLSGREWYTWSEDGAHQVTVFSSWYDEENEMFYIREEWVEQSIDMLLEIAQDLNINLEHELLIPVYRIDDILYFEL